MSALEEVSLESLVVPRAAQRIRRAQRWHAGLVLAVPALACVVATFEVALGHVSDLDFDRARREGPGERRHGNHYAETQRDA